MLLQIANVGKPLATCLAGVRSVAIMHRLVMLLKVCIGLEAFVTFCASKWPVITVARFMPDQMCLSGEALVTLRTGKGFLAGMSHQVPQHVPFIGEGLWANGALESLITMS